MRQNSFSPIKIDFDTAVGVIRPVHNVGRMPEYERNSAVNRWFTEANMTSCRTHDVNVTDLHNIFPDFSRDADDETAYRFEAADKVLAAIADTGMEPFFRLGISYSDPVRDRPHLLPPSDYEKWARICEHVILHYNEGWANGFRYHIRYWELWNEPDNEDVAEKNVFWQGTPEEFYRLYDVAATYLKQKFPRLKIGGFGSCGFYALTSTNALNTGAGSRNIYFITFFEGFLDYIAVHRPPMDFFSWHSYTTTDRNARYLEYVREKLRQAGYGDAEIICNEWNCVPTENDKLDRRYGANQTSMLLMFQNAGLDMAHYYCGICNPASVHAGMFVAGGRPSTAYYGFWAFGQLYRLGNQVRIGSPLPADLYAVAATGAEGQALLMANVSETEDRPFSIDAGRYEVDKCLTVTADREWAEIPLPAVIERGSMLYVTFRRKRQGE